MHQKGLRYVGLLLARLFANKYSVIGFDIKTKRVAGLKKGVDKTFEVLSDLLNGVLVSKDSDEKGK
ncbi:hypothetical protein [Tenacibaculum salmonis]|uniref:hypothetical protein n=1 Tax=Tenacibaculum sp. P3-BQ1 TaxID=3232310 RepID=UPI0034DF4E84